MALQHEADQRPVAFKHLVHTIVQHQGLQRRALTGIVVATIHHQVRRELFGG
jgi:hypothetical protein